MMGGDVAERIWRALDMAHRCHVVVLDRWDWPKFEALSDGDRARIIERVPVQQGGKMLHRSCIVTSADHEELLLIHTL